MYCSGCEQHLPPSEFFVQEHNRFVARCKACRFKAARAAFEEVTPSRAVDDLPEPVQLKERRPWMRPRKENLSVRRDADRQWPVRERSNIRLIQDARVAAVLAWTFAANPGLGERRARGEALK